MRHRHFMALAWICALASSAPVSAHSFGVVYSLPLPFHLYAWGAAAALVCSFVVAAFVIPHTQPHKEARPWTKDISNSQLLIFARRWRILQQLQLLSVATLLLCIATGLFGNKSPYGNFNMTFFWIVVMLGFSYFSALFGNLYAAINPFMLLGRMVDKIVGFDRPRRRYDPRLAYWPALLLYFIFIWIELFAGSSPYFLSIMLLGYTLISFIGVALFGSQAWFRYCDFFSVFFRLLALMSPVNYIPSERVGAARGASIIQLRRPFSGLLEQSAEHVSLLVFILFMLSSTAFDGLHETIIWKQFFWLDMYHGFLQYYTNENPFLAYAAMSDLYRYWQGAWLLLSPFIYLAILFAVIGLSKVLMRSTLSVKALALKMAYPLLPIALVYHIAHYYTLLETQGIKIISLVSDPFGWGQNWFGTAKWLQRVFIPDVSVTWHVQLGLIVVGHIISVYLAHKVVFADANTNIGAKNAARINLSQLPMLFLMIGFTASGLWILSQPVA
ncbi:hypothetical protein [Zhongshania arctica]|uniref:Fenitrothion hydrolase FedB n=1 Tax=Zhongshania arctica TaxID=3238302 RepID=A0ABV3TYF2_9GAMM